jgi:hypothetical protein
MLLLAVVEDKLLALSGILVIWSPKMCTGMDRAEAEKLDLGLVLVEGSALLVMKHWSGGSFYFVYTGWLFDGLCSVPTFVDLLI